MCILLVPFDVAKKKIEKSEKQQHNSHCSYKHKEKEERKRDRDGERNVRKWQNRQRMNEKVVGASRRKPIENVHMNRV